MAFASIAEAAQALAQKNMSASELTQTTLEAINTWEPHVHAYVEVLTQEALAAAKQWDEQSDEAGKQPLGGIPIAVKDLICTTEGHTTAASKILEHFASPYDATVVQRLKRAGAIIIGKANLDEFAMGSSTEYSARGVTRNPWDTSRVAGGSSGGSAATVATGAVLGALGTDTGGSIRQPANFCGVVGLKPTYGRVSRFGVISYGSSLDQVGPITRTVKDAALLLEVLAGHDVADATSSRQAVPSYTDHCGQAIDGITIGIPAEFFSAGINAEVTAVIQTALQKLESLGATIKEVSLPLTQAAVAVYFLIAKAEASTNLARYDGIRFGQYDIPAEQLMTYYESVRGYGFGPEVKRAILMGTYALSSGYYEAWYKQASKVRTLITQEYQQVFTEVDVIAAPVTPETAFTVGSKAGDPLAMYLSDALTVPLSVAGLPAISVPVGFAQGLPVGLQIAAPHFAEADIFRVASAYEQSESWWQQVPT